MQYKFKFLQTGGVPLTNDLMALIEEAYGIFESLGDLAGNQTIISGCAVNGGTVEPGIIAIDGHLYYFEGGIAGTEVYIHTEEIYKTFQDQTDKVLIEKKTVRFGLGTPQYYWADFTRLKTIKEIQAIAMAAATQAQVTDLANQIQELQLLTAPIKTKKIRWFFPGDLADIPAGWEIDTAMQGYVPVGVDPTDFNFDMPGKKFGTKKHQLTLSESAKHRHRMRKIGVGTEGGNRWGWIPAGENESGSNGTQDVYVSESGGDQPHNNMQPSIAGYWIKPI